MAYLIVVEKGKDRVFPMSGREVTIGRSSLCDISLEDPLCSRTHCIITALPEGYKLIDKESSNGTRVNGLPVKERLLGSADLIEIGEVRIRFLLKEPLMDPEWPIAWGQVGPSAVDPIQDGMATIAPFRAEEARPTMQSVSPYSSGWISLGADQVERLATQSKFAKISPLENRLEAVLGKVFFYWLAGGTTDSPKPVFTATRIQAKFPSSGSLALRAEADDLLSQHGKLQPPAPLLRRALFSEMTRLVLSAYRISEGAKAIVASLWSMPIQPPGLIRVALLSVHASSAVLEAPDPAKFDPRELARRFDVRFQDMAPVTPHAL